MAKCSWPPLNVFNFCMTQFKPEGNIKAAIKLRFVEHVLIKQEQRGRTKVLGVPGTRGRGSQRNWSPKATFAWNWSNHTHTHTHMLVGWVEWGRKCGVTMCFSLIMATAAGAACDQREFPCHACQLKLWPDLTLSIRRLGGRCYK